MNEIKLLILDLQSETDLGEALREALASSSRLSVSLQHFNIADYDVASCCDSLLADIPASTNLIFLISIPALFKQISLLVSFLKKNLPQTPIIFISKESDPEKIFDLLKCGISDYIVPPLKIVNIFPRIWRLIDQTREPAQKLSPSRKFALKQLIGESPAFLKQVQKIPVIADCDAGVLLLGETGTGKELCARAIHYLSQRACKPFIPVNCGAIPLDLLENELFGHERGAYTGATTSSEGLLNKADGGTLFLDEIDCLPLLGQVKLLRFLQDKMYRSLGSTKKSVVDVRIIAATNVDINKLIVEGKLRRDLYYRLNVISLVLPPLRERNGDVVLLARHFLAKYATILNKPVRDFSVDGIQTLLRYNWPGNVRELEHVIEQAVVFSEQATIGSADLHLPDIEPLPQPESFRKAKSKMIEQFEKSYIQELLLTYHGNITKAARAAQKHRRAFWQLIRKYQVDMNTFRTSNK
jgi:two-component system response regulator GlrR